MKGTVFKYQIMLGGYIHLDLPTKAVILDIQIQEGSVVLWAILNTANPMQSRTLYSTMTGVEVDINCSYLLPIKTLTDFRGLVWHIFEVV